MKPKRLIDHALLDSYHAKTCIVCGRRGCDPCHIQSIGAGGDDIESNLYALCRRCHTEQHAIGIVSFATKYPVVLWTFKQKGWQLYDGRLRRT